MDFQIMREMRWTWRELQETPVGVRVYAWDCIRRERSAQAEAARKAQREVQRQQGAQVVEH